MRMFIHVTKVIIENSLTIYIMVKEKEYVLPLVLLFNIHT